MSSGKVYLSSPLYHPKKITLFLIIYLIMLLPGLDIYHGLDGFFLAFVLTLICFPIIYFVQSKNDKLVDEYYQQEYLRDKEELDEYLRIERLKMQDGRCANCNSYLDPNLLYCPNCNFKIDNYT